MKRRSFLSILAALLVPWKKSEPTAWNGDDIKSGRYQAAIDPCEHAEAKGTRYLLIIEQDGRLGIFPYEV